MNAAPADVIDEIAKEADAEMKELQVSILSKADLSLAYTREEYKEKLDKLQAKIEKLHGELYRRRIRVVLGFEGWDAGGKGGAIKRLTAKMDPRGYVVNPTASPNDIEKAIIICGDSGAPCQRTDTWRSLTGPGTGA